MTDLAGTVAELAELWPALANALARDTGGDGGGSRSWSAAAIVNADVLAAMVALDREVPAAVRAACATIGEPWRPRDVAGCLLQVPRLAGRMHDLGIAREENWLAWQAGGWLRMVKRVLGLRRPDTAIGYFCPYMLAMPERHEGAATLFAAGDEGFLRKAPGGFEVEWVHTPVIYCASPDCDASWGYAQWPYLGRLLAQTVESPDRTPATASTAPGHGHTW